MITHLLSFQTTNLLVATAASLLFSKTTLHRVASEKLRTISKIQICATTLKILSREISKFAIGLKIEVSPSQPVSLETCSTIFTSPFYWTLNEYKFRTNKMLKKKKKKKKNKLHSELCTEKISIFKAVCWIQLWKEEKKKKLQYVSWNLLTFD